MRGSPQSQKSVEVFAKSVYREMKANGYTRDQIVAFASEMLELITTDARARSESQSAA